MVKCVWNVSCTWLSEMNYCSLCYGVSLHCESFSFFYDIILTDSVRYVSDLWSQGDMTNPHSCFSSKFLLFFPGLANSCEL